MKIVIIGDGKVGHKLTTQLSEEDYDIVLILLLSFCMKI